jgi:predicted urease superfamily metal-dependent hydrolase
MILYIKDLKNSAKKLLDTIKSFTKVGGYKINLKKFIAFLYTHNEWAENKYRKIIQFTIASKNKTPRNEPNEGCERPPQGKV